MSSLADRIRGVVGHDPRPTSHEPRDLSCLGGSFVDSCFVVERRYEPSMRYGSETVGAIAARLRGGGDEAVAILGAAPGCSPFVFFDLETTGLAGGAGTQAFLVGLGRFDDETFETRQFLLVNHGDEPRMLSSVLGVMASAGSLVSFNGKSFDAPLLELRHLYHRLPWSAGGTPHLDVLHPARRFWDGADHSLVTLETQVLGARRVGDVPGFEIPARYFQFVRCGNAWPLVPVLEHNRLDLVSLAGLTARLFELIRLGPGAVRSAREALALGRVFERAGLESRAQDAYERAADKSRGSNREVWVDSVRSLAALLRRARQHDQAATLWRQLLDTPACPERIAREASEALAIHHEHRVRDLETAKQFALRSLTSGNGAIGGRWADAIGHRVARLDRKLAQVSNLKSEVSSSTGQLFK